MILILGNPVHPVVENNFFRRHNYVALYAKRKK